MPTADTADTADATRTLAGLLASGSAVIATLGVAMALLLTWMLVGVAVFAIAVGGITVVFAGRAFGTRPRPSAVPVLVAGALYVLALLVGLGLAVGIGGRGSPEALVFLPLVYVLLGWVAAPVLFFAVLSVDPLAPESASARITLALRLTERVPARRRATALVASAVALFGPLALLAASNAAAWPLLLTWVGFSVYPVIASALLVRTYLYVRPALTEDDAGPLPAAPGHLRVHALLALGLTAVALPEVSHFTLVLLVLVAGLAAQAFQELVRAHQLGRLETLAPDAPPGRRAFTGRLTALTPEGGRVEDGSRAIAFGPQRRRRGTIRLGDTVTLVGTFSPQPEGFRVSGRRSAPADATLYAGGLPAVLRTRVRRALGVAHAACATLTTLAALTLL